MSFKLGLAQTVHPANGDAESLVRAYASEAADRGVDLLVFPESLMSRFDTDRNEFIAKSQPIDGYFSKAISGIAAHYGLWIVYTMNEANDADPQLKPYNTAVMVDALGIKRASYRKVHLFESGPLCESDRMTAGDDLFQPVSTPFGKVGMGICYDLRFPEAFRPQALSGCDLMLLPSAWVSGPGKERQWKTLLAARAIENQMFVAGVSRADEGYIGCSSVFDPFGNEIAAADSSEQLLVCDIDSSLLAAAREGIPVFNHRRPDVYAR